MEGGPNLSIKVGQTGLSKAIVDGMQNGVYTGLRLDQFVGGQKQDLLGARQVVNDHDCAAKIAALANAWLAQIP